MHALVDAGAIPRFPERRPLPEEVRLLAAEKRPDTEYKSVEGRLRKLRRYLKGVAARVKRHGRRVAARRSRNARYGFGIVTEKTLLELEKEHSVEFPAAQPSKPLESEPVIKEPIRQGNAVPDEPKPATGKNNASARSRNSWGWEEFDAWVEEEKRKLNEREAAQKELKPESKPEPKKEKAVKSRSPERAQPRFPAPPEIPKDSGRGMDL